MESATPDPPPRPSLSPVASGGAPPSEPAVPRSASAAGAEGAGRAPRPLLKRMGPVSIVVLVLDVLLSALALLPTVVVVPTGMVLAFLSPMSRDQCDSGYQQCDDGLLLLAACALFLGPALALAALLSLPTVVLWAMTRRLFFLPGAVLGTLGSGAALALAMALLEKSMHADEPLDAAGHLGGFWEAVLRLLPFV